MFDAHAGMVRTCTVRSDSPGKFWFNLCSRQHTATNLHAARVEGSIQTLREYAVLGALSMAMKKNSDGRPSSWAGAQLSAPGCREGVVHASVKTVNMAKSHGDLVPRNSQGATQW